MGMGHRIWERMLEQSDHDICATPNQTIIEIAGEHRVLIENHLGVVTYGNERILIKVTFGFVSVCGYHLEMKCMSGEQVLIFGDIHSVSLQRRAQS